MLRDLSVTIQLNILSNTMQHEHTLHLQYLFIRREMCKCHNNTKQLNKMRKLNKPIQCHYRFKIQSLHGLRFGTAISSLVFTAKLNQFHGQTIFFTAKPYLSRNIIRYTPIPGWPRKTEKSIRSIFQDFALINCYFFHLAGKSIFFPLY